VKILKGLQGLSPQILELLKAKEKAKQLKKMTQSSEEQKEAEMMEELIHVSWHWRFLDKSALLCRKLKALTYTTFVRIIWRAQFGFLFFLAKLKSQHGFDLS
jgi:hypothetical protein